MYTHQSSQCHSPRIASENHATVHLSLTPPPPPLVKIHGVYGQELFCDPAAGLAFLLWDVDGDGVVSRDDVKVVVHGMLRQALGSSQPLAAYEGRSMAEVAAGLDIGAGTVDGDAIVGRAVDAMADTIYKEAMARGGSGGRRPGRRAL